MFAVALSAFCSSVEQAIMAASDTEKKQEKLQTYYNTSKNAFMITIFNAKISESPILVESYT